MNNIQSICVILSGALGDLVRGLSVAVAIKAQSPDTHITWVVDSTWHSLVNNHPALDEVLIFDRAHPIKGAVALARELRSRRFDVTLDMQRHCKSGICSFVSGASRRIGFHPKNCKEGNHFFNSEYIPEQDDRESKLKHYFAFLEVLGLSSPTDVDFGFSQVQLDQVILPDSKGVRIGMVLSSSWETKDWPVSGYQKLLLELERRFDCEVVLLGTAVDTPKAAKLRECSKRMLLHDLTGKTSLPQLLEVIRSCSACVGPDSGPGHLAAAVDVPYISLFGPTPAERVAPYKCENLVVVADVPCRPCSRKVCPGLGTACMRLIAPERVLDTLRPFLS